MKPNKFRDFLSVFPLSMRRKLFIYYKEKFRLRRIKIESEIPKVHLIQKNVQNCQVLLNRESLLRALPQNCVVAELGVDLGNFSTRILDLTKPSKLHLIDNWNSKNYDLSKYNIVLEKFKSLIIDDKVCIHKKTSLEAVADFPDDYFDWIYIDTDHSYLNTKNELLAYSRKVKYNGLIAGHDYTKGNYIEEVRVGVVEAVHEFCVNYDWELIYLTLDQLENQSFAIRRIIQHN